MSERKPLPYRIHIGTEPIDVIARSLSEATRLACEQYRAAHPDNTEAHLILVRGSDIPLREEGDDNAAR
jgi:hypothetical protein